MCRTNNDAYDEGGGVDDGVVSNATKVCEDSRQLTQLLDECVSQIKFCAGERIKFKISLVSIDRNNRRANDQMNFVVLCAKSHVYTNTWMRV